MAVYVDPPLAWPVTSKWPHGSVTHLYADDPEELHAFAAKIGMRRAWCSDHTQPGSVLLHYDLTPRKRKQAVDQGAVEVDHRHGKAFYRTSDVRRREVEAHNRRMTYGRRFRR